MENTTPVSQPVPVSQNNFSLPPIKQLFSDSYKVFTKSLLSLIVLSLISLLITVLIFLFAGLLLLPLGVYQQIPKLFSSNPDLSVVKNIFFSGGAVFGVTFLLLMIFGYVFQIAPILTVAEYEARPSAGSVIKRSFRYILPLILLNSIVIFITFGSLFILILPAFILGFFFMFAFYEVVLSNQKPVQALRNSVSLVSQHFGEIVVRIFIYFFGYTFFIIFIPNLIRKIDPETGIIISFYVSLVSVFIGWFGLAFYLTLYKQAKNAYDTTRKTKLIWIVLFAIAGWLIGGFIILYTYKVLTSKYGSVFLEKLSKTSNQSTTKLNDSDKILSYAPSECGLLVPVPKTEDNYEGVNRKWLFEEMELDPKGFYVLDKDSLTIDKFLGSFIGFKDSSARLGGSRFRVSYPGINIYCVDNTKNLTDDEYVGLALLNKEHKVTKRSDKKSRWGEVLLTPIYVEIENDDGTVSKNQYDIGVSKDGKKLIEVILWGVAKEDPNYSTINEDINIIARNLKYRGQPEPTGKSQ